MHHFTRRLSIAAFALAALWFNVAAAGSETPEIYVQTGHTKPVGIMAVDKNEHYLVSAANGYNSFIKTWNIATAREIRTIDVKEYISDIYFVSSDTFMVITSSKNAVMYNVYGKKLETIKLPSITMYSIAATYVSKSKQYLYTISLYDDETHFFDMNDGAEIKIPESKDNYRYSRLLDIGSGYFGVFYDSYAEHPAAGHIGETEYVIYNEDLKVIKKGLIKGVVYIGGQIRVDSSLRRLYKNRGYGDSPMITSYDLESGVPVCSTASTAAAYLSILPDNRLVVDCYGKSSDMGNGRTTRDRDLSILEFMDNCIYKVKKVFHRNVDIGTKFTLSGSSLFVADCDSLTVTRYDYAGKKEPQPFGVKPLVFGNIDMSQDKLLDIRQDLSLKNNNAILNFNLWNLNTASLERFNVENTSDIHQEDDSEFRLWKLSDPDAFFSPIPREFFPKNYKKEYKDFYRQAAGAGFVIFLTSTGTHPFKTRKQDSYIELYDTTSNAEIARMYAFADGEWVIITPEGYFNASANGAKYLNVRIGNQIYSVDNFYEKYYNPSYVVSVLQGKKDAALADIRHGVALPPEIKIIAPAGGTEVRSDEITIQVSAKDMGGGINEIRLYQNGKAIGDDTRGLKAVAATNGEQVKSFTVTLVDGANTFRALGFSNDRTQSNSSEIEVVLTAPRKDVAMHVLTAGINTYENPALNLNYAEPDARGVAAFFKKEGQSLFADVTVDELYNSQATKTGLINKLKQLEQTNPQDVVVIYLAGHGENINEKWYFIPYELTYPEREDAVAVGGVSSEELSTLIKNIKAQKILVLIDACKSGAALLAFRGFEDRKALSQLSRATGIHIVAASTKDQYAAEVKELGHGVFTYTLLQGLSGKAAEPGRSVTVRKLMSYLEEQLPEITKKYRQESQYPVIDSKGMDFPLAEEQK